MSKHNLFSCMPLELSFMRNMLGVLMLRRTCAIRRTNGYKYTFDYINDTVCPEVERQKNQNNTTLLDAQNVSCVERK